MKVRSGYKQTNRRKGPRFRVVPETDLKPDSLEWFALKYIAHLQERHLSESVVDHTGLYLGHFFDWLLERGTTIPGEVTEDMIERYRGHLYRYRRKNGKPTSVQYQYTKLQTVMHFFAWLTKKRHLVEDPAAGIDLPRLPKRLPRQILTLDEVERILAQPDIKTTLGLRDRAMMEIFWSTGMRRMELSNLTIYDIQPNRMLILIREGKGRKDRMVPIGKRALLWLQKYLDDARPKLVEKRGREEDWLFLNYEGYPIHTDRYSAIVRGHVRAAKIDKQVSCHAFRHTCATLMLENGADTRYIQQLLGHENLGTTQIYTHVSIKKLQEIHEKTHPAKMERTKGDQNEGSKV